MKYSDFGKIIRYHRKKAKLTQQQLAELASVGKTVIFDIEKGKEGVKIVTLLKVLDVLNISLNLDGPLIQKAILETTK